jgi:hypothetical protein
MRFCVIVLISYGQLRLLCITRLLCIVLHRVLSLALLAIERSKLTRKQKLKQKQKQKLFYSRRPPVRGSIGVLG